MFQEAMSITKIGVTGATFLFVVLATYFLLSAPVELIFDTFADTDSGLASDEMVTYLPNIRTAMTLSFAIFLSLPLTWLVIKVLGERETGFNMGRFRP